MQVPEVHLNGRPGWVENTALYEKGQSQPCCLRLLSKGGGDSEIRVGHNLMFNGDGLPVLPVHSGQRAEEVPSV